MQKIQVGDAMTPEERKDECKHCGADDWWFDRTCDAEGNMDGDRCNKCGRLREEPMNKDEELARKIIHPLDSHVFGEVVIRIAKALRQVRNEALEEGANKAENGCSLIPQDQTTGNLCTVIAKAIRQLKREG